VSISPSPETNLNFSEPATYTVTAEDGSTREYAVSIIQKNGVSVGDEEKIITGFYFREPLVQGIIDQVNHTIALTVPAGTDLRTLRPEIYYKGVSVSPISGQPKDFTGADANPVTYTVRPKNGASLPYKVYVFTAPEQPKVSFSGDASGAKVDVGTGSGTDSGNYTVIVEFPTYIENPVFNINYPAASAADNETLNKILDELIKLQAEKKDAYNHITNVDVDIDVDITVINPPPANPADPDSDKATIDGFYFTSPAAVGTIDQEKGTITVTVPYGTNLRNLTAGICYTGKEIVGVPGSNPLKHTRSFDGDVKYTVKAQDGTTTKDYTVTVKVALNNAKEITAFSFAGGTVSSAMISAVPGSAGIYPIDITVVGEDTCLATLVPVITFTGESIKKEDNGDLCSDGPGTVTTSEVDFSGSVESPVGYIVTAENGTAGTYSVTVRKADDDDDPEITGFYFTSPLAAGAVNQTTDTISVTVPSGANIRALAPTIYFNGVSVQPGSGQTKDFSGPVAYTVTGITGKKRTYTVTVTPTPSNSKDITRFTIPGVPDAAVVIGAVPDTNGEYPIDVWVPAGLPLTSIAPAITHTGVSITPSADTPLNFTGPQTYTVTAEDGSTKKYKATVNARNDDAKIMTSFIFNEVPIIEGAPVRAVGSIDQGNHTVTVTVPSGGTITSLVPTITYIGKSISENGDTGDRTSNPFTGTAKSFDSPQTYTVKDQKGVGQAYTVTVIKQNTVTVIFTGEAEKTVIKTNTFDQEKGIVTVEINTDNVSSPYGWYVDGIKQPVPSDQSTFSLNVASGSFAPGRHEIMVSGKKDGLHYTGKVYFEVSR
jgi:hypothetical protein